MRLRSIVLFPLLLAMTTSFAGPADATMRHSTRATSPRPTCDADDLCGAEGFTILTCTQVDGDFDGADVGKPVGLENGMIFTFETVAVAVAVDPQAVVLARALTYQGKPVVVYKLLIDDEIYDVERIR